MIKIDGQEFEPEAAGLFLAGAALAEMRRKIERRPRGVLYSASDKERDLVVAVIRDQEEDLAVKMDRAQG